MGIQAFDDVISYLQTTEDKNGNKVDMESVIASQGADFRSHYFRDEGLVNLRSIAKPVADLALGAAIGKGLRFKETEIFLDTLVLPFISEYCQFQSEDNRRAWSQVTVKDLLRVTLGHDKGIMFSKDIKDRDPKTFVNYVVNYPITETVGEHFVYSNAGSFILSTLVTEFLGLKLVDFVDEHLFRPLSIKNFDWDSFGKYTAGCTGLWMSNRDLHKIGQLLLNQGNWEGAQIVPSHFVSEMTKPQVASPTHRYIESRAFAKWSYGLNLWICEDGSYFCDGTDGQYLVIIPDQKLVVTALGPQPDALPVSNALGLLK
ncbi:serine hydrolase domain-containing protein [Tateyamaria sp.]|uniref:serine hydrolase domain-containing protein n=1 Tax=Tateyamaria sp. TaxID=1929288 RepID=UPI00329D7E04